MRLDYNDERPHEGHGHLPPSIYGQKLENSNQRCLRLGEVDRSVGHPASQGNGGGELALEANVRRSQPQA